MSCGHAFHAKCLRSWFRDRPLRCPTCRGECLEGMSLLGPRLAPRIRALMRTVPNSRRFFPTYILSQLENPSVVAGLRLSDDSVDTLVDVACGCFTEANFFASIKRLGM